MKKLIQFVILPCLFVAIACMFYFVYMNSTLGATDENIEFILEHINHRGVLVDYQNEIGVKEIDDIKYYITKDKIKINYGEITLNWSIEDFLRKENRDKLERIGIYVKRDKQTQELRLFWHKEEITKWVS